MRASVEAWVGSATRRRQRSLVKMRGAISLVLAPSHMIGTSSVIMQIAVERVKSRFGNDKQKGGTENKLVDSNA